MYIVTCFIVSFMKTDHKVPLPDILPDIPKIKVFQTSYSFSIYTTPFGRSLRIKTAKNPLSHCFRKKIQFCPSLATDKQHCQDGSAENAFEAFYVLNICVLPNQANLY